MPVRGVRTTAGSVGGTGAPERPSTAAAGPHRVSGDRLIDALGDRQVGGGVERVAGGAEDAVEGVALRSLDSDGPSEECFGHRSSRLGSAEPS